MNKLQTSQLTLGIIAGGQLGKMLIRDASKWDIATAVLDPDPHCPARTVATSYTQGDYRDFDAVYRLGSQVDLLTLELENVNVDALAALERDGYAVAPSSAVLRVIQDKGAQKDFYTEHAIPTAPYRLFASKDDILQACAEGEVAFPFVQKRRVGGYDGRGVQLVRCADDLDRLFSDPSVVEDCVDIAQEIGVIVARNRDGDTRCFAPVEMVFDPHANLVERIICPAALSSEIAAQAEEYAIRLAHALNIIGLLAVEFFYTKDGTLLVNEVAPRPHNSGHLTMENAVTSQFEQHLRAILNLPLGSTEIRQPAVMLNLLGEDGHEGPVMYTGINDVMAIEDVHIHLYGKKITRPQRKMGHITLLAATREDVCRKADTIHSLLKVISCEKKVC